MHLDVSAIVLLWELRNSNLKLQGSRRTLPCDTHLIALGLFYHIGIRNSISLFYLALKHVKYICKKLSYTKH